MWVLLPDKQSLSVLGLRDQSPTKTAAKAYSSSLSGEPQANVNNNVQKRAGSVGEARHLGESFLLCKIRFV